MCLTVTHVPTGVRASNCVLVHKDLVYSECNKNWFTPFQYAIVPKDGVLHVKTPVRNIRADKVVEGRAIHAYCLNHERRMLHVTRHKAYAFGLIAYGNSKDLICSLLYIPEVDSSPDREARLKQIKKWLKQGKGPTNSQVKKLFLQFVAPTP